MTAFNMYSRPFESFRVYLAQHRQRTPCPNRVYDMNHQIEMGGNICNRKHSLYHWQGRLGNEVTLVADSLCKWVQDISHLEVQACPGVNLTRIFEKMKNVDITSKGYLGFILCVGTNEIADGVPAEEILAKTEAILDYMAATSPTTRLAVGLILPRPQDFDKDPEEGAIREENRRRANGMIKKMCKIRGAIFANSISAVRTEKILDLDLFAEDHLHLSDLGIAKIGGYYEGVANSLMERLYYY